MSRVESFLTAREEEEIVDAILEAEKYTSGEIRVHIESSATKDHYKRAQEVFHVLKMDNTKFGNGVLIYIAVEDHKFVIYGDKGIDAAVPNDFWETTKDVIERYFKMGEFKEGIVQGVLKAGTELQAHFPWHTNDSNELDDEISKG
ncbi:MAG: TPM domain-containing protein [Eudoraea sp.]|nr:TPM domain-containing protein [Eudoraea sp.]